jgi:hypothetical protein
MTWTVVDGASLVYAVVWVVPGTARSSHVDHPRASGDLVYTKYRSIGDPFPVAVPHETATWPVEATAHTPGVTPGSPTVTHALGDHAPQPRMLRARTRAPYEDPFTPKMARVRTLGDTFV